MPVRLVSQEELPGPLKGYRLIERLGRGGFGEVWKVEAPGGLLKAAKFVFGNLDELDEESRPAEQEAKALERVKGIRHPYILSLEQVRVIDGQLIIVMELADRNLWDRFRECRGQGLPGIPRDELLRYMEETAEALDLMNNHYQIQHLDIKPQNLFLVFNHIKVADFGLAKVLEGVKATVTGGVTPVYAAPETFEGWVSRYSDQYSLAIVFQELLTGCRPFTGTNTRQLLMQHLNGTPDLTALPPADRPIISRALAKIPEQRWPTCTDLVRALKSGDLPEVRSMGATVPVASAVAARSPGDSSVPTMLQGSAAPAVPAAPEAVIAPDSSQATRMAGMGAGTAPVRTTPAVRDRTPAPATLPPLIKPGGSTPGLAIVTPTSTPRLVTPATAGNNPAQTLSRPLIFQTARMGSLGLAPPEKTGEGVLLPALIVALGQTGRRVVEQFKRLIAARYGSPARTPHIRTLYIDTDPDITVSSDDPAAFSPREIIAARLNRSTHYLQRDSLPSVEQWMPHGVLYKLPRHPGPTRGVRAFGRLALIDHYRVIAQRIRQEIETFLTDDALLQADHITQLGLRSNRPRAYVVANLAGGTGSGMFLDVAYLIRHELRQVGYLKPEVCGVFFVPPAGVRVPRTPALGNTYAALAELYHFQSKASRYQAAFDKMEAPLTDGDAPFARVAVLQLPPNAEAGATDPVLGTAARTLYQELLTPAGRIVDTDRDKFLQNNPVAVPCCQTYGLFRLSWPRNELLATATVRLAQKLLQQWTSKDATAVKDAVGEWVQQQWLQRRLNFESLIETLENTARTILKDEPERVFDALVDPLRTRTPSGGRLDTASVCIVFEQVIGLVGKPEGDTTTSGSLITALDHEFENHTKEWESQVAVMAATFLEVPEYRLAAAEEATRQLGQRLKRQIEVLEPIRDELDRELRTTYSRLIHAIAALDATGIAATVHRKANAAEAVELLRVYPRKRLQLHFLDMGLSLYRKLLENVPEYLRELNGCRAAIVEMNAAIAKTMQAAVSPIGLGKLILPDGCHNIGAAVEAFLAQLPAEQLRTWEESLQNDVKRKFRGLGHVCLKPAEKGPAFRDLLLRRSRELLDSLLDHSDPATVFFRLRTEDGSAVKILAEAFDESAPTLTVPGSRPSELIVLQAPPSEEGQRLIDLTRQTFPHHELVTAPLADDILFYREFPQVPLTDLPQLGPHARDAYQNLDADHPPHARIDVAWQAPPEV
ncbi:MAG: tubulin-like doman-containing protein [Gemmataceae bacterium]|nr:protein kinase [Gemmata sp.]MDW8196950.1 tubulin-like doman-containing protein [Gemmataceae bacterium]